MCGCSAKSDAKNMVGGPKIQKTFLFESQFSENPRKATKIEKVLPKGCQNGAREPFRSPWLPFRTLWLPFGRPSAPFWRPLAPFWHLPAPFWRPLAPLWHPLGAKGSQRGAKGSQKGGQKSALAQNRKRSKKIRFLEVKMDAFW